MRRTDRRRLPTVVHEPLVAARADRRAILTAMIAALLAALAPAAPIHADSTAYCLRGTMSDGTHTRAGSAAVLPGRHPLGTHIYVPAGGPHGRRRWTIRDHIGRSSQLDFWTPSCGYAINDWGRRTVRYRIGWPKPKLRLLPRQHPFQRDRWTAR